MSDNTPRNDPKVYGHIPGIPVGKMWATRADCRKDGVHAMLEHGIHGDMTEGAYSICLSGGYKDDKDNGNTFIYTGSGGKGTESTSGGRADLGGPQCSDQSFDNPSNRALEKSVETRRPIRVIRGPNPKSSYGTAQGYRYDGLYLVDRAWREPGEDGYLVCKFECRRIEGQLPIAGKPRSAVYKGMLSKLKRRRQV